VQRCYSQAAVALEDRQSELKQIWTAKPLQDVAGAYASWATNYRTETRFAVRRGATGCIDSIPELENDFSENPQALVAKLRRREASLNGGPLEIFGVEMPDKATVNVLGTVIKVPILRLAQTLQFALTPVLMLWFASLYNTRYRETTLVMRASKVSEVFPHIINVYPTPITKVPSFRKRARGIAIAWFALFFIFALTRVFLFLLLTLPAFAMYILSVALLYPMDHTILDGDSVGLLAYVFAFGVFATYVSNIWLEFMPWHFKKIYTPIRDERYE
jgi:hypothetical protein